MTNQVRSLGRASLQANAFLDRGRVRMPSDRQRLKAAGRGGGSTPYQADDGASDKAEQKFLEKAEEHAKRELARKPPASKK